MLIQCDYQIGDFFLSKGKIYFKGFEIATTANLTPDMTAGTDELYILEGKEPLDCPWLVIYQSRFPVFYRCKDIEKTPQKITLYCADKQVLRVKPYIDGVHDCLFMDPIYVL
jgi:hypothetical protein